MTPRLIEDQKNIPKVLYVLDSLQTGGAEKSILDIASRIKEFQPVVCHIYKNDFLKIEFEQSGVRVISLNIAGPYNFLQAYRAFRKVLQRERPALVLSTLLRSELISRIACKVEQVPNLGTFVNDTYSRYEWQAISFSMKIKVGFFWLLNMLTARLCAGFLSNSESIKESNCRALFIRRNKVKVIYRGRNPNIFKFSSDRLNKDTIKFLSVGRLLFRKGHAELIKAFSRFLDHDPKASLLIAGEGTFRKNLEQLIGELHLEKQVTLSGNVKDIAGLMQLHDVFVFPSHYEGFSGTLVEAMFSGIPIIASDIDMNKEALDGSMARFFPLKNVQALGDEMIWTSNHKSLALQMATHARTVAEERFTIDVIARQHEHYYKEILDHYPT